MGLGVVLKATHRLRLRRLGNGLEAEEAGATAAATELAEHGAASRSKCEELREDIASTQKQVGELNESWGVMREMYETSKRVKKMREKALIRRVVGRFMYATLAMCVKEWASLTQRRKRLAVKHEWQTKVEDLEFEAKSLQKRVGEAANKLHFVQDAAQAERVRGLVARMGFRSLGMWFLMWRAYLKVSYDERRQGELDGLRQEIEDTIDHSQRLTKKLADQEVADERMSVDLSGLVAADTERHSSVLPAVLSAVAVAERVAKSQLALYPAGSRTNGLRSQMGTLRRNGTALSGLGGIADAVQSEMEGVLPPIEGGVPLSPAAAALQPEPPSFPPQASPGSLSVDESIVADLPPSEEEGRSVAAPRAHQRSRPFSRGRTLVQPKVEGVRQLEIGGRGDLSLPGGVGAMRGSMRRRFAGKNIVDASSNTAVRT